MVFREIGGLRCDQVLQALDRYVDEQLTEEEQVGVTAHVRGCENCRRFGGAYGRVVAALRAPSYATADEVLPPDVLGRALAGLPSPG